jgi:hypothetical protein
LLCAQPAALYLLPPSDMGIERASRMADSITIRRPDDWHVHLRDGAMMAAVLPHTARQFARAIVMPNLVPPVTTIAGAIAYRERIVAALPAGADFTPLMTATRPRFTAAIARASSPRSSFTRRMRPPTRRMASPTLAE